MLYRTILCDNKYFLVYSYELNRWVAYLLICMSAVCWLTSVVVFELHVQEKMNCHRFYGFQYINFRGVLFLIRLINCWQGNQICICPLFFSFVMNTTCLLLTRDTVTFGFDVLPNACLPLFVEPRSLDTISCGMEIISKISWATFCHFLILICLELLFVIGIISLPL